MKFLLAVLAIIVPALASAQTGGGPPGPGPTPVVQMSTSLSARLYGGGTADCSHSDWTAIQTTIEAAAARGGGTVILDDPWITGGCWYLDHALQLRSGVTLYVPNPATRISCGNAINGANYPGQRDLLGGDITKVGQWPTYSCVLFGGWESDNLLNAPVLPANALAQGDRTITLTTASDAGKLAAGDVISVETTAQWSVSGYNIPSWRQLAVVVSANASTGVVTLRRPMQGALASAQVLKLSNLAGTASWPTVKNASGGDTLYPQWGCYDCGVLGGFWDNGIQKPFTTGSGAVDCLADVHRVVASRGAGYGNAFGYCRFHADAETMAGVGAELAQGSHDNTVDLGEVTFSDANGAGSTNFARYFGANEASRNNTFRIGSVHLGTTGGVDVVQLWNTTGARVNIGSIDGGAITGNVVTINPFIANNTNAPGSSFHRVVIGDSNVASQVRYATIASSNSTNYPVTDNRVSGNFHGAITDSNGGLGLITVGRGNWIENTVADSGSIYCTSASGSGFRNVQVGAPTVVASNFPQLFACLMQGVTDPTYEAFAAAATYESTPGSVTVNSTTSFFKGFSIPGGTFQAGDIISVDSFMDIGGANGTKTVTYAAAGSTAYSWVIPAAATKAEIHLRYEVAFNGGSGNWTISINGWKSNSVDGIVLITTGSATASNLAANAWTYNVTHSLTTSGDTENVRRISYRAYRPGYDNTAPVAP